MLVPLLDHASIPRPQIDFADSGKRSARYPLIRVPCGVRMRRFTRLTNAFSRKLQSLEAAVALHFLHYNFVRVHQTLKTTPAMAAGVADHEWRLE